MNAGWSMQQNNAVSFSLDRIRSHANQLQNRRARDAEQRFWLEGVRNFVWAADAGFEFDTIVYSRILLRSALAEMLSRRLRAKGVTRIAVSPEQFRRVSHAERASGIAAITRQRWAPLDSIHPTAGQFVIILDYVRSAGNLGTLLRTAEAAGACAILFVGRSCDPYDPAAVRASMGGVFGVPLVRCPFDQLRAWATEHRVALLGMSPYAARQWTELPEERPIAFVLGEERHGLSPWLAEQCEDMLRLPIRGRADSLNVSIAAAVAMYEMVRRSVT